MRTSSAHRAHIARTSRAHRPRIVRTAPSQLPPDNGFTPLVVSWLPIFDSGRLADPTLKHPKNQY